MAKPRRMAGGISPQKRKVLELLVERRPGIVFKALKEERLKGPLGDLALGMVAERQPEELLNWLVEGAPTAELEPQERAASAGATPRRRGRPPKRRRGRPPKART